MNYTVMCSSSIQSVMVLMDDALDEEPYSESKSTNSKTILKKLSSSLSIKDVSFRYATNLPNVVKGVTFGINSASYVVLCGGSGSGKSSVLSLLIRYQSPSEGSVEWDGSDFTIEAIDNKDVCLQSM